MDEQRAVQLENLARQLENMRSGGTDLEPKAARRLCAAALDLIEKADPGPEISVGDAKRYGEARGAIIDGSVNDSDAIEGFKQIGEMGRLVWRAVNSGLPRKDPYSAGGYPAPVRPAIRPEPPLGVPDVEGTKVDRSPGFRDSMKFEEMKKKTPRKNDAAPNRLRVSRSEAAAAIGAALERAKAFAKANYAAERLNQEERLNSIVWFEETKAMLSGLLGASPVVQEFADLHKWDDRAAPEENFRERRTKLLGIQAGLPHFEEPVAPAAAAAAPPKSVTDVFIVIGHDEEMTNAVARFVEKVELTPIILREQADSGTSWLWEKLEEHSDVGAAIVLMSPDDVGGKRAADAKDQQLEPRARQNVVVELGFFCGKLGRKQVFGLVRGNVITPGDYVGAVYTKYEDADWPTKLSKGLKKAGMKGKWEKLI
ncbi:MAG: nucleotide-binding [Planctomycetota bacterium]|nr:MAG: nucleotide-binding [Planctomycetota bacterium]